MTEFRVLTRALGASPLVRLALGGDAPPGWYPEIPAGVGEWQSRAESVLQDFAGRDWVR